MHGTLLPRSFKGAGIFPLDQSALMQQYLISDPTADVLQVRNCSISGIVATEQYQNFLIGSKSTMDFIFDAYPRVRYK